MDAIIWIPATVLASIFQVGRNALQRGVMTTAGPWGATLVRFLFGLPFSSAFAAIALLTVPAARPHLGGAFWLSAVTGAGSQVLATAALLVAMRRAGFAIGTALQQSSLPLAALVGLVIYHDRLSAIAWAGVAITTVGLIVLSWPQPSARRAEAYTEAPGHRAMGVVFGLLSGLLFGFSLNAFRHAALAMEPVHPVFAAIVCVVVVQVLQVSALGAIMLALDPASVRAVLRQWRASLGAGLCGTLASVGWFVALALSPAAPVRALGIVEAPIAALAGHRVFRETITSLQMFAGVAVAGGIVLTSLW